MPRAIRALSPEVIAQIAAGEVVTRAGDAVKELVENAVDAVLARSAADGSPVHRGQIAVEIHEGGHARIQVADDGCGIPLDELPLALCRHATSKIGTADDLHGLTSLGFRGEALAAISAVADVTILSATAGSATGAQIACVDGQVGEPIPHARRPGTTVTVERLFERVPARRKYQRAASSETAHIGQLLQAYALIYPEIAFSLICDSRTVLRTTGSGDLREAAGAILGPEAGRELLALRDEREGEAESSRLVGVTGLVGPPALHRATRSGIFIAVNRRPIDSRSLVYALEESYATLLPVGRHAIAVVDLTVPPDEIDANVHPTKREVRLLRDRLAFGVLQQAVRATLVQTIGIPRLGETRGQLANPVEAGSDDAIPFPLFAQRESGPDDEERGRPKLGGLRILGQVGLTYIICEGRAGLYLVDQHAAHERVMLERLEHDLERKDRRQLLLDPVVVELPRSLRSALDDYVLALEQLGFDVEPFGDGEAIIRSVPSALRARDIDRVLKETHETLDAEGAGPDWRERLAVLMSCKSAVKAGQRLEIAEMQSLLEQLDEATLCGTCSHGRPTAILLSHSQLEREFGRR